MTLFLVSSAESVKAQNVFHIRFDTVTAKAGDTVAVNVYYSFTSTHAHTINYFQARFSYDTTEIYPVEYDLAGTASGMFFDTTSSHLGITARGQSEIDLSNPVLFRIKFRVNHQLADTAFIHWDSSFVLFDASENVDQVTTQDGWIRTATAAGHVVLTTPSVDVKGVTQGYSPDSVPFRLPVIASNLSGARMRSAVLSFTYDSTVLSLSGALAGKAAELVVDSMHSTALMGGRRAVSISVHAVSDVLFGGDTLIALPFVGLVGLDTVCETLSDVSLRPTNSDALIGNTVYTAGSICLKGSAPSSVAIEEGQSTKLEIYPNPATSSVRIEASGFEGMLTIGVFDVLGRPLYSWDGTSTTWQVPADLSPGVYQVIAESGSQHERIRAMLVIER